MTHHNSSTYMCTHIHTYTHVHTCYGCHTLTKAPCNSTMNRYGINSSKGSLHHTNNCPHTVSPLFRKQYSTVWDIRTTPGTIVCMVCFSCFNSKALMAWLMNYQTEAYGAIKGSIIPCTCDKRINYLVCVCVCACVCVCVHLINSNYARRLPISTLYFQTGCHCSSRHCIAIHSMGAHTQYETEYPADKPLTDRWMHLYLVRYVNGKPKKNLQSCACQTLSCGTRVSERGMPAQSAASLGALGDAEHVGACR